MIGKYLVKKNLPVSWRASFSVVHPFIKIYNVAVSPESSELDKIISEVKNILITNTRGWFHEHVLLILRSMPNIWIAVHEKCVYEINPRFYF